MHVTGFQEVVCMVSSGFVCDHGLKCGLFSIIIFKSVFRGFKNNKVPEVIGLV